MVKFPYLVLGFLLLAALGGGCSSTSDASNDAGSSVDASHDSSVVLDMLTASDMPTASDMLTASDARVDMTSSFDGGADMMSADAELLDSAIVPTDADTDPSLAALEAAYWSKLSACTHIERLVEVESEFWWWGTFFTRVNSDESVVTACLSQLEAASCDELWASWVPFRRRGWPSDAVPSDTVLFSYFVASEWPFITDACADALRLGLPGESCEFDAECSTGHFCRRIDGSFPGVCEALVGEGEDCSDAVCSRYLECGESNLCEPAPGLGESCVWTCAEGLDCTTRYSMGPGGPIYGTCVTPETPALPELGDACGLPLSCGDVFTFLRCDFSEDVCVARSE